MTVRLMILVSLAALAACTSPLAGESPEPAEPSRESESAQAAAAGAPAEAAQPEAGGGAARPAADEASSPPADWIEAPLSPGTYQASETEYREGIYEIKIPAYSDLEYTIAMNEGESIVYHWSTGSSQTELLSAEFHGHTIREGDEPGTVMFYNIHNSGKESGTLKAPFTGIHGWYLNNESEEDLVVLLRVAGFYSEIPDQL